MINWLQSSKTGNFYRRSRRLSKSAITAVFKELRATAAEPSRNLFLHVREELGEAVWSAISFFYEREPSFLELPARHTRERVCGFLLLVEYKQHVAVFKSGLDLPAAFRSRYLRAAGSENIEAATARADATFEQIRLRNMAVSKHAMRSKTLEADDLRSVISPSGSSRYVPAAFRTRDAEVHYMATPSTGRISTRSERVGHEELIAWSTEVIDRLTAPKVELSSFIRNFARPLDLGSFPSGLLPASVALDVAALVEHLFEEPAAIRLVRRQDGGWSALTKEETEFVLEALSMTFAIRQVRSEQRVFDPRNNEHIGEIRIGKTRISLRRLDVPETAELFVERLDVANGSAMREPLKRYIDQNNLFTILFNRIDVIYLSGSLYRDPSLADGGEALLAYLRPSHALSTTTSEKGQFSAAHTAFDADSVFGVLINELSTDEVLVCDDLGDEWADFIGINSATQPKTVTFYHAKHGALSLSATAFHASVGQAIKNLQHLRLTLDAVDAKEQKWGSTYTLAGHETQIRRMIRGDFSLLRERVKDTVTSPDTVWRVQIVTDSLSRHDVASTLAAAQNGQQPPAHFVQLYSLLMGFFSACAEVGAFPGVICRT